jgi:hypothetical protein
MPSSRRSPTCPRVRASAGVPTGRRP